MSTVLVTHKELQALRRSHLVVEGDCWFSCPKSDGYCGDDPRTKCYCGADEHNARIDALLAGAAK